MKCTLECLVIATLAVCGTIPAAAGVIHKWVDADGITHYSDAAPAAVDIPVTVIDVPSAQLETRDSNENYYSISNQWERMRRERIERDKLALEKARLEAERKTSSPAVVYVDQAAPPRTAAALPAYLYPRARSHRMHRKFGHRYRAGNLRPPPRQAVDPGYFPHVD